MTTIQLANVQGEARVDTRAMADQLGRKHQTVYEMVKDYQADFEQLGKVRFETGPLIGSKTGQKEKFALLNEDQCYLLLTFSRNTAKVRQLKVNLVKAFKQARLGVKHTTARDRLPMQHKVLEIGVDRRVSPTVVQGNINRFMGVRRSRYASMLQLEQGIGLCDRYLSRTETAEDQKCISDNHASMYGESRQLSLLTMDPPD